MEFQTLWPNGASDSDEEGFDFYEYSEEEDEEDFEVEEEEDSKDFKEEEEEDSEDFEGEEEEDSEDFEEEEDSEDFDEEDSEDFQEEEDSEDFDEEEDSEDFEEEEDSEDFDEEEEVIEEVWMNDYCNVHKILLVGEGDFSFSASLAVAFGSAPNIIATSLDSTGYLRENYRSAMSNIQKLTSRGCKVVHGVDATEMAKNLLFMGMKFDRIVFNFPLAGFFPNTSRQTELRRHRKLVGKFLVNAKKMITSNGEIHVRHKSNGFFREWNLELLGSTRGLRLLEEVHFNYTDYPGYCTKYGFCTDNNFNCNPSKTYKFGLA